VPLLLLLRRFLLPLRGQRQRALLAAELLWQGVGLGRRRGAGLRLGGGLQGFGH
jgi:hypothetical protein